MRLFCSFLFMIWASLALAQSPDSSLFIAFYNVENIFDPIDDSLKNDDAFTPEGFNRWGYKKFNKKLADISKVIMAMNNQSLPDVIGLAEIENQYVLERLCYSTPLKAFGYHFVHYESPDRRGIDVALLYRKERVKILHSEPITVVFPFDTAAKNRDILYVQLRPFGARDTLHLMVNHWTSRFGGLGATIPKRNYYAALTRKRVDSLQTHHHCPYIILMGDFNDYPQDESFQEHLKTKQMAQYNQAPATALVNLMENLVEEQGIGTHKNKEFWGALDQYIVTANFLQSGNYYQLSPPHATVFAPPFLLMPDEKYGGAKAYRTYLGPRYMGGYSDHLPIYIVVSWKAVQ